MEEKPSLAELDTDNTLKIVRSVRDVRPAHYLMKIESFSLLLQLLLKTGVDEHQSYEFEAGGFKWRLLLYPNGNKKRGVNGYISLYLSMSDPTKLSLGTEVNVIYNFFILDQIKEKYLTLEDRRVRQFHPLKTMRGISRLISLSAFHDPSNGYLIDDCCIFGAEVFVVKSEGKVKGESLTFLNEPLNGSIVWKINKFSNLKDESIFSKSSDVGGCKWRMKLYPCTGKSLKLVLTIHDLSVYGPGMKVFVEFILILKDQIHGKNLERTGKGWYCSSYEGRGHSKFISLANLHDKKNGYIVNDTLVLEAKITYLSVMKCLA